MESEAVVGLNTSQSVHPREMAQDFGVHLRTIFRWIKYGFLDSENGRVNSEYRTTTLLDWKRSCWFHEAIKRLNVSNNTFTSWKNRGLIETLTVMGFERPLVNCIDGIIKRRKRGTFSLHPTHSLSNLILEITGVNERTLKHALDNSIVPSDILNGVRMIPNEDVERIEKEWTSSCRSAGAQRILGKSKNVIGRLVARGLLPSVIVLGQRRIILKGIAKTPEEKQRLKAYLKSEGKKYSRRVRAGIKFYRKLKKTRKIQRLKKINANKPSKKFLCKREESAVKRLEPVVIPDYKPMPVRVKGFESKRLTTCEEAVKATGKTIGQMKELFSSGRVRGEVYDDQIFLYILSVEALVIKLKQGIKI